MLRVLSDILDALDRGDFAVLTDAASSFSSIWYGRPCHSAASPQNNLRHHWYCTSVDHFLSPWEKAPCPLQRIQLNSIIVTVWSSTRIGSWTDPVPSVHGRSTQTHWWNGAAFSPLCGRHPDIRILHSWCNPCPSAAHFNVCRPHFRVDASKPPAVECHQNRTVIVRATSATRLPTKHTSPHWLWHDTAGEVRAKSGDIHWQQPIHEKKCFKGCLKLFRRPPPTPKYP